jgi:hypothetical protein
MLLEGILMAQMIIGQPDHKLNTQYLENEAIKVFAVVSIGLLASRLKPR